MCSWNAVNGAHSCVTAATGHGLPHKLEAVAKNGGKEATEKPYRY